MVENAPDALAIIRAGFLGSLVAGLATGIGALPIFLRRQWSENGQIMMLAVAGGVMLAATVFSLILPALDEVVARTGSEAQAAAVASAGVMLGAVAIWLVHSTVPHDHFVKGHEGPATIALGRHWLFIVAITLHNFPEGMSVGVSYGSGEPTAGYAVTLGIGLQNLPEGLAVAAALVGEGFGRMRAFLIALATGMVEPLGGLVGATAVGFSDALLPWGLAFAAGAMLFVISGEIIPETHRNGKEHRATLSLVAGFVLMMILDQAIG